MSIAVDVSMLLYASGQSSPLNQEAVSFLHKCAPDLEVFRLAWLTLKSYLRVPTRGNLVPDAHVATILRSHGVATLYTHDRSITDRIRSGGVLRPVRWYRNWSPVMRAMAARR